MNAWIRSYATALLAAIRELIGKLQAYYLKKSKPARRTKYREGYRHRHQRHNLSVASRIDGIADQLEAYKEQQEAGERRRRTREIWTIVGLFAAAGFAALQWSVFREQARDFRDQERRQLRGYLGALNLTFSCGDCLPTEDDRLQVSTNNFGQTPLYIIAGILWEIQYSQTEDFPDTLERYPRVAEAMLPRNLVIYPKIESNTQYPINEVARLMFYKAKTGDYWLILRGIIRYRDVFGQRWDNFFCFMYDPATYKPNGMLSCPKYNDEVPAREEGEEIKTSPQMVPLPDVTEHKF